jgi:hypothetical protein
LCRVGWWGEKLFFHFSCCVYSRPCLTQRDFDAAILFEAFSSSYFSRIGTVAREGNGRQPIFSSNCTHLGHLISSVQEKRRRRRSGKPRTHPVVPPASSPSARPRPLRGPARRAAKAGGPGHREVGPARRAARASEPGHRAVSGGRLARLAAARGGGSGRLAAPAGGAIRRAVLAGGLDRRAGGRERPVEGSRPGAEQRGMKIPMILR